MTTPFLATSAIDLDTDKAIQEILRGPQFADTTILTIAYVLSSSNLSGVGCLSHVQASA